MDKNTHVTQEETRATVSEAIGHPTPGDEKELMKTEAISPNFPVSHLSSESENGYVVKEKICSNTTNVNTVSDAGKNGTMLGNVQQLKGDDGALLVFGTAAREVMNPGEENEVVPPLSHKETTPFENVQEERASPDDDLLGSPPSKHPSPSTDANCLENAASADTEQPLSAALTAEEKKEVTEATRKGDAVRPRSNVMAEERIEKKEPTRDIDQDKSEVTSFAASSALPEDTEQENGEEISDGCDGIPSAGHNNYVMEAHTPEEKEWLSMGLNLGDALSKIAQLTKEKESALVICQEVNQVKALLAKVQSRLEDEMSARADLEAQVQQGHTKIKSYEEQLSAYKTTEDDLQKARANLVESKQKEVVLSNRLNDAKKKEATKSTVAGRLEADNENLKEDLKLTKDELLSISRAKTKLESNMAKLKSKAVERVKQAETALSEERELNEERKKKMKVFVETKAEELREAKESANGMQKELEETRASLRSSRDREEAVHTDLEAARLKYRELQRNLERMKKNSEQLHLAGRNAEQELEKSTNETEEHKKKRISAKHEIMQMVRLLESERSVSAKLRESVKFSFLPKVSH